MAKEKVLKKEIRHLMERGEAAYQEGNDELLIKFINCICKAMETQDKLDGEEKETIRLILRDDPQKEEAVP